MYEQLTRKRIFCSNAIPFGQRLTHTHITVLARPKTLKQLMSRSCNGFMHTHVHTHILRYNLPKSVAYSHEYNVTSQYKCCRWWVSLHEPIKNQQMLCETLSRTNGIHVCCYFCLGRLHSSSEPISCLFATAYYCCCCRKKSTRYRNFERMCERRRAQE